MKKLLVIFCIAFVSVSSYAAEFVGKIQSIAAGPNLGSLVLIRVEGQSTTANWSAQCSTNNFWSFKFDPSVAGGKETYSMLLAAYTSKSPVVISCTGTCSASDSTTNVQNINYTRFDF